MPFAAARMYTTFFFFRLRVQSRANSLQGAGQTVYFRIAHDNVAGFEYNVTLNGTATRVRRRNTVTLPCFEHDRKSYRGTKVRGALLEWARNELAANRNVDGLLNLDLTAGTIFHKMTQYFSRENADERTLARPDPGGAVDGGAEGQEILDSFDITAPGNDIDLTTANFNQDLCGAHAVPCRLARIERRPMEAHLYVVLLPGGGPAQLGLAQDCVAADWSDVYNTHGTADVDQRACRAIWLKNIEKFMHGFMPLTRGQTIVTGIVNRAVHNHNVTGVTAQHAFVDDVRNDIEARMVTTNNWNQPTEDPATEPYQYSLAQIVGIPIFRDTISADPIKIFRNFQTNHPLTPDQKAFMIIQMGLGRCAEHAHLTYVIMKRLSAADGGVAALLGTIIRSGWANQDHAFCVGGRRPNRTLRFTLTRVRPPGNPNSLKKPGTVMVLFHPATAAVDGTGTGWVCDPYLGVDAMGQPEIAHDIPGVLAQIATNAAVLGHYASEYLGWKMMHPALPAAPTSPQLAWQTPPALPAL